MENTEYKALFMPTTWEDSNIKALQDVLTNSVPTQGCSCFQLLYLLSIGTKYCDIHHAIQTANVSLCCPETVQLLFVSLVAGSSTTIANITSILPTISSLQNGMDL